MPHKQEEVRKFISAHRVSFCGLVETKIRSARSISIAKTLLPGWKFNFNYSKHHLGRFWIAWDPALLNVSHISSTA